MVIRQRQETFKPVTLGHHLVSPANQGQRHCHAARILSDWSMSFCSRLMAALSRQEPIS
jgi:hypothetical protein